jgi:glycosyltransferase involved in cell wall biosynthesis/Tfp pilus assembly protein PilF
MSNSRSTKAKLALVYGNLPTTEEIDQFKLLSDNFDIHVIAPESIIEYISRMSHFNDLKCLSLPDHDENPTFIPGLERALAGFDVVIVKERLGLYAFQAVKAKWRNNFRLLVWVDNLIAFPGDDLNQFRIIRSELSAAADAFLVQSEAAKQVLLLEGVDAKRISFFEPWVEQRAKRSLKQRSKGALALQIKDSDFVIGHLGQIEWEEDLTLLVHAAKRAMTDNATLKRKLRIVVCGIGSYSEEVNIRAKQLGLENRISFIAPGRDAVESLLMASDVLFCSTTSNRDRLEGDPYRLMTAMAYKLPVIASRNPIVEEYVGKHRIDFCPGSVESLSAAIIKASEAKSLVNNIVNKNTATYNQRFGVDRVRRKMNTAFAEILAKDIRHDFNAIDRRVIEIETLISTKDYINAVDLIEGLFATGKVPVYQQSNLYRLIGDCFVKLGDALSGKTAYNKAVELDPFSSKAQIGLGTVALTRNSFDVAVIHFQRAVSVGLNDENAFLGLGLAFEGLGELNEANNWVSSSLKLSPLNTAAIFTLVKLSYARNQFEDARTALTYFISRKPQDSNMLYALAGIEYKSGNTAQAENVARQILTLNPNDERALKFIEQLRAPAAPAGGAKG